MTIANLIDFASRLYERCDADFASGDANLFRFLRIGSLSLQASLYHHSEFGGE